MICARTKDNLSATLHSFFGDLCPVGESNETCTWVIHHEAEHRILDLRISAVDS